MPTVQPASPQPNQRGRQPSKPPSRIAASATVTCRPRANHHADRQFGARNGEQIVDDRDNDAALAARLEIEVIVSLERASDDP